MSETDLPATSGKDDGLFLNAAHIEIYKQNAFRVTGLPVDATLKEITKKADKLKLVEELGGGLIENNAAFPLKPLPGIDQIRESLRRLKDPELRFVEEFFWFWPAQFGTGESDVAIQAILNGNDDKAYETWSEWEDDTDKNFIAWHNLAVMFHLIALDWSIFHIAEEVTDEKAEIIEQYWRQAFERWEKIVSDDRIWDSLKMRVRSLNDPRLTTGFVRRMREALPQALDKINAEVALKFAEQGRIKWAKLHIDFMNETHQGLDNVNKVSDLVLLPTRNRVLQFIKIAKEETDKAAAKGLDAANKLLSQCQPLMELFELFYGSDAYSKTELFDEVAATGNSCLVQYQKKTGNNEYFVKGLKEFLKFATAMDVRTRIQENIEVGEGNIHRKYLEPVYNELKRIQDSKSTATERLSLVRNNLINHLEELTESEGRDSVIIFDLSDAIAIVLRGISIDAYNIENNSHVAITAITLALKYVHDVSLKSRLEADLVQVQESTGTAKCFFCGVRQGSPARVIPIKMYKITEMVGTDSVRYKTNTVSVPRCEVCHSKHNRHWGAVWWGIPIGALVGALLTPWAAVGGALLVVFAGGGWLCYIARAAYARVPQIGCLALFGFFIGGGACLQLADNEIGRAVFFNILGGAAIGAFAAFWIAKKMMHEKSPEDMALDYKRINSLVIDGWKYGDKPAGYS